ncbi:DUF481 domain-containing protein [Thalassotalea ponticola]|uniref:DUF481 domain-containing protein n=1 Tax=Thalassotalea ponticola TaxID=1523392 RepID=UPI0025B5430E|nr:DUF481 domain-containing protein [Thalassotalea ponticola]MDN3653404.1 DUF481 domain-containing protein [Thalassotalea ponticola]
MHFILQCLMASFLYWLMSFAAQSGQTVPSSHDTPVSRSAQLHTQPVDEVNSCSLELINNDTSKDWLLTKEGELFAGELISMYHDKVDFNSDEVGTFTIKMKNIAKLQTNSVMSFRLDNGQIYHGQLFVSRHRLLLREQSEFCVERSSLLSIAPSENSGDSLWDGHLGIGLNFRKGNSERFDYTAQFNARRLTSETRTLLSYTGLFSQVQDPNTLQSVKTEENHRFNGSYDWYYSRQLFFRLPSFEYYTDKFKNIAMRVTGGVAAGYTVFDQPDFRWDVYVGPSLQYTKFERVDSSNQQSNTSPALLLGTIYERDLSDDIEFHLTYDVKLVSSSSGKTIHHLETGLAIDLISDLDIDLKAIVDHVAEPIDNEQGITPERTDMLFIVALSYDF